MNKVILMGRLTRDPELRHSSKGTAVVRFGIAVNSYAGKDKDDHVLFIDCVTFSEAVSRHFRKGDPILLEGRLDYQRWEKDGRKYSRHEVVVDRWYFLPREKKQQEEVPF